MTLTLFSLSIIQEKIKLKEKNKRFIGVFGVRNSDSEPLEYSWVHT